MKSIIVGVDPGITTGVSILDSRGQILAVHSKRDAKKSDIIKFIMKFGKPLVIATDVTPSPHSVEKIASSLGCKLFTPEKPITVQKKIRTVKEFSKELKNTHESDALAAGLIAWKNYRVLLDKVFIELKKQDKMEIYDEVVAKLVKEYSQNISEALSETSIKKLMSR